MAFPYHVFAGDSVAATGSTTVAWSGEQAGDLGLLVVECALFTTVATPSGWTLLGMQTNPGGDPSKSRLYVFYKFATSISEPDATLIVSGGDHVIAYINVFAGVDPTTPIEDYAFTTGSGSSLSMASLTAGGPQRLLVYVAGSSIDVAGSHLDSASFPWVGYSLAKSDGTSLGNGGGLVLLHSDCPVSGATGSGSITFIGSSSSVGMALLLKPPPIVESTEYISGSTSGSSTITGTLSGTGSLAGSIQAILETSSAALSADGSLSGLASAVLSVTGTGNALEESLLAGIAAGVGAASGSLSAFAYVAGSSAALATATGTIGGLGQLQGTASSVLSVSASIGNLMPILAGTASAVLTVPSAILDLSNQITGTTSATATVMGQLTGAGRLSGIAAAIATASGLMSSRSGMSGKAQAVSVTAGNLQRLANATISTNFRNKWLAVYASRQALHNKISGLTKLTLESQSTSIISLSNQITHPVTGLAALSTAQNTLTSRVAVVEGEIGALAQDVTLLEVSVEGKASVAVTNSLTARIDTIVSPYGVNMVLNPALAIDAHNWITGRFIEGLAYNPTTGLPVDIVEGRNLLTRPSGKNTMDISHAPIMPSGSRYISYLEKIACEPNTDYILSGYISSANAAGQLRVYLYGVSNNYLGEVETQYSTGYGGGSSLANWLRAYVKFNSGPNVRFLMVGINLFGTGLANARGSAFDVMLEAAAPGQTTPSAFNVGRQAAWAEWDITLDANGHVSGVRLANDGRTSDFTISADRFAIVSPSGGARTEYSGGNWRVYDANGVLRVQMGVW